MKKEMIIDKKKKYYALASDNINYIISENSGNNIDNNTVGWIVDKYGNICSTRTKLSNLLKMEDFKKREFIFQPQNDRMSGDFRISSDTRIIAKKSNCLLVTNNSIASLNTIFEKAVIIDEKGNILSPKLPIGVLSKDTTWVWENKFYYEKSPERIFSSIIGFAVGDALGVPTEFIPRQYIKEFDTSKMNGYGTHNVPAGAWSDDTSMVIAGIDSICRCDGMVDYDDIMDAYVDWFKHAKYTSIDKTFGVGDTIFKGLVNYMSGNDALDSGSGEVQDNGNGSLMRCLPISLLCALNNKSNEEIFDITSDFSSMTHSHEISKMACYIYTLFIKHIISGVDKRTILNIIQKENYKDKFSSKTIKEYEMILTGDFQNMNPDEIPESGYVIDTLEIVLYSIINTNSFEEAVTKAISFGYDTDTTAAITGSIAGIMYGIEDIPEKWLSQLKKREYLEEMANSFADVLTTNKTQKLNL